MSEVSVGIFFLLGLVAFLGIYNLHLSDSLKIAQRDVARLKSENIGLRRKLERDS